MPTQAFRKAFSNTHPRLVGELIEDMGLPNVATGGTQSRVMQKLSYRALKRLWFRRARLALALEAEADALKEGAKVPGRRTRRQQAGFEKRVRVFADQPCLREVGLPADTFSLLCFGTGVDKDDSVIH